MTGKLAAIVSARIHLVDRQYRFVILGLLLVAGCVSYIDRTAIGVANLAIAHDFGLSFTQLGLILSSFAWAYMVCQIPAGILADRFSARFLIFASLMIWGVAQLLSGVASSAGMILVSRALLGIGEAPLFLAGTKVITQWFNARERGTPISLFNASSSLGQVLAPLLLGFVASRWGWHAMFVVLGLLSFVVAVGWISLHRPPPLAAVPARKQPFHFRRTLSQPVSWVLAGGFIGVIYLQWLYASWLPSYLQSNWHISIERASYLSALPQFFGFLGGIYGGPLIDRRTAKNIPPIKACHRPLVYALFLASLTTILAPFCQNLPEVIIMMSAALFFCGLASTCGWTLGTVVSAPETVATVEAIQNIGGSFGGVIAPIVTGGILARSGSYPLAMGTAGAIAALSAAIYGLGIKAARRS
ncbi:MFS transporter [Kozakia baliensis]|uniref:MFS transporter n=1 Tax=Kozakia baliensis TaxID=153496 RepID=UPI00116C6762|nr:MFS transporter [Kozakia baliensis]GBR23438.1 major facilitator superfamily transporter [Kozakia baliensis NRIC 0488]GEL65008.1 MFS transporter [Kozakia baliensis]